MQTHIVNAADCFCRFLIDDCRTVFVRARFIAVGICPVGVPARLPFGFQYGAYLFGCIRRVPLVKHVHDGHHIHARTAAVCRIHVVRKGDKAYAVGREDIVDVLPDLNVVASEPRQVFHDDGIYLTVFGIFQQAFNPGALEVGARPAVVDVFVYDGAAVFCREFAQDHALVFYRQRLACFFVVARKPEIKPCSIQLFLL